MKELSIEEKAKAYDKVREKIAVRFGTNVAEEIFSEFEESEDERIRKGLINYFNHHKNGINIFYGIKGDDILAWLEKQGKSSDQIHYWTEEEIEPIISDYLRGAEHYGGMIARLRCLKPKSLEKQAQKSAIEMKSAEESLGIDSDTYNEIVDECIYGEQKPAWSEEDKLVVEDIEEAVINYWHGQSQEDLLDWLKSLKQRIGGLTDFDVIGEVVQRNLLEEVVKQMTDTLLVETLLYRKKQGTLSIFYDERKEELERFLKSICTWKPSDEQMATLYKYAEQNNYDGSILTSLYNDLKKLREDKL